MKQPIKITILIAAILLAIGGVLFYMHRITQPPMPSTANQFATALMTDTVVITNEKSLEKGYARFNDELTLFQGEKFISTEEFDKGKEQLYVTYAPKFVNWCFEKFHESVWNAKDHQFMLNRISTLQSATYSGGHRSIIEPGSTPSNKMNEVKSIIQDYRDAWAATHVGAFVSLSDSRNKISRANSFKSHAYINNCTSLMQALSNVSAKLETAHYAYLASQVARLARYRNYSDLESYDNFVDQVNAVINEYDENAKDVYGKSRSTKALIDQGGEYYSRAYEYFNQYSSYSTD